MPYDDPALKQFENYYLSHKPSESEHAENWVLHYGVITPRNLEPEPKNPIIANFFHQIQLADELGSGVRTLYKYVRTYSGALPIFDEGDIFRLTVPLNAEHSPEESGGNRSEKSVRKTGQKNRTEKSDRKPKIELVEQLQQLMRTTPNITQNEMAHLLGIARSTLNVHIDALKKSGRIRRVGPDKGGHWEVIR